MSSPRGTPIPLPAQQGALDTASPGAPERKARGGLLGESSTGVAGKRKFREMISHGIPGGPMRGTPSPDETRELATLAAGADATLIPYGTRHAPRTG